MSEEAKLYEKARKKVKFFEKRKAEIEKSITSWRAVEKAFENIEKPKKKEEPKHEESREGQPQL